MTRRRMSMLLFGVLALGGLFVWRVLEPFGSESPPLPERPLSRGSPPPSDSDGTDTSKRNAKGKLASDGTITLSGATMGTTYKIKFVPPIADMAEIVQVQIDATLSEVNTTMSTYDESSELSLLNRTEASVPFAASEPLFAVLTLAEQMNELTNGAFDITVGPLVRAYGFGAGALDEVPEAEQLEEIFGLVGMKHVALSEKDRSVLKAQSDVNIDLSAIAKGYGVDQVALALEKMSIKNYMVEVGGEIRTLGNKPDDSEWTLAIELPKKEARSIFMTLSLPLAGAALATSGDYRNFRKQKRGFISHTIDPRAGKPVERRTASASVIRPTAAEADALATAFCVLSPEESMTLANERGFEVLLLVHREGGGFQPIASEPFLAQYELPSER